MSAFAARLAASRGQPHEGSRPPQRPALICPRLTAHCPYPPNLPMLPASLSNALSHSLSHSLTRLRSLLPRAAPHAIVLAPALTPALAPARGTGAIRLACLALAAAGAVAPAAHAQPAQLPAHLPAQSVAPLPAQAPAPLPGTARVPTVNVSTVLPPSVMAGLERAHVPLSSVSVVIEKIGDRQPSVAVNAGQPMMPASTMKLVTTWTGLSMLGADYRWKTSAYTEGTVDASGTLHGTLYIKGTGDPKLVPEELIDLVQKIRAAGIAHIDGALVLDKTAFDPSTRDLPPFDDDADAPYNVGPDPLLYSFKSVSFTFVPSRSGVSIDVVPPEAQWQIDNRMRARGGRCGGFLPSPQIATGANGVVTASFDGSYSTHCGERTLAMAAPVDHSTFFADGFLGLWQQAGGTFRGAVRDGAVPPAARLLAVHESPPLADIVHDINKFSNNVMARNLFLTIGAVATKSPSTTAKAAAAVKAWLLRNGIDMPELVLDNGCGLSREEHVSALSLANLLQVANASAVAQPFVDSLPVAGVDGTMRHRLTNTGVDGNAHIKTGTLRDVRAIAGYVAAKDGQTWIVVSLINDPRASGARAAHDALLDWVYNGMPEQSPVYVEAHPKRAPRLARIEARKTLRKETRKVAYEEDRKASREEHRRSRHEETRRGVRAEARDTAHKTAAAKKHPKHRKHSSAQ